MEKFVIRGGKKLYGAVRLSRAKNSCLPIIASSILFNGKTCIRECPKIADVCEMANLLKSINADVCFENDTLCIDGSAINSFCPDVYITKKVRASFFTVGAMLSRFKRATISQPGGCNIGPRPVNVHIDSLKQLGVLIKECEDMLYFDATNMKSGCVKLLYPSVGATENIIMASVYLSGETVIYNVAKEPEIIDLCKFLNCCGCIIKGAGTNLITVSGVKPICFDKICYTPIFDRIEAGTFMLACACVGGELQFEYDCPIYISSLINLLKKSGIEVYFFNGFINLKSNGKPLACNITADVFPNFPTDLQPQLCACMLKANGTSYVRDNVFKNRFAYTKMLLRFGANLSVLGNTAIVKGVKSLRGCDVCACDLRGGASLVMSGLNANGQTIVYNADIIRRGYEHFDSKLRCLGANIEHIF